MPKLLIHFVRFGPYHNARLRSAQAALEPLGWHVEGLQVCSTDSTYAWAPSAADVRGESGAKLHTVLPGEHYERISPSHLKRLVKMTLDSLSPDAVAIAGWSSVDARACLRWCKRNQVMAILMSETRYQDSPRRWWKERVKTLGIKGFSAALVGGRQHREYLMSLGFPEENVVFGYNVVDNGYFRDRVAELKNAREVTKPFFLASNRFVEIKNLGRLIEAYAVYVRHLANQSQSTKTSSEAWDLVLLGDGPLNPSLRSICEHCDLIADAGDPFDPLHSASNPRVFFPGFKQVSDLPRYYDAASAFVHPANEEPWGLVINEAMASSLPILSSRNVAAAVELVDEGVNGYLFDPASVYEMADRMLKISVLDASTRDAMGEASLRIVNDRVPTEAFGDGLAAALRRVGWET